MFNGSDRTRLPKDIALHCVLRTREAADFCGVSVSHWRRLYWRGCLPAPILLGERRLGWRVGDLIEWLQVRQLVVPANSKDG